MKAFLIAIAIVFGGLATTNPGRDEYLDWVQHQDQSDALGSIVMSLARPLVNADTKVENFTFFSVFTTAVDATHFSRTLGLMHHFYSAPANSSQVPSVSSVPDFAVRQVAVATLPVHEVRTAQKECETVSSKPAAIHSGVTLYEGHAVCAAAPCSPDQRIGAHWVCPDSGGTPIGRWEYTFGPKGTQWRQIGDATWHPLAVHSPAHAAFNREQIDAMLAKCSQDADARGLTGNNGYANARWAFRRDCMSKMGVEPTR